MFFLLFSKVQRKHFGHKCSANISLQQHWPKKIARDWYSLCLFEIFRIFVEESSVNVAYGVWQEGPDFSIAGKSNDVALNCQCIIL